MTLAPKTQEARRRIQRISERKLLVKALVYGEPGVGKTYLCCTAPRVSLLLTEASVAIPTIRAFRRDRGVDVDVWEILSGEDLQAAIDFLRYDEHRYETVALDSLSDLNERIKRGVVREACEFAAQRGRYHDPDIPEESDWGRISTRTADVIRQFHDLPVNVVMTAHVMDIRNELRRVPHVQPRTLASRLPGSFNLVGHLGVYEVNGTTLRRLLVQPTEIYVAKNPGGALPPSVDNPDLSVLLPQVVRVLEAESLTDTTRGEV